MSKSNIPPPILFVRKDLHQKKFAASLKNIASVAATNTKKDEERHSVVKELIQNVKETGGGASNLSNITENLIPNGNNVSIGAANKYFNSIYVNDIFTAKNTIHIGDSVTISATENGTLALPTGTTVGGINYGLIKIKGVRFS